MPGWRDADSTVRRRIVAAAERYLVEAESSVGAWLGHNPMTIHRNDVAALRAFILLKQESPEGYARLAEETWRKWASVIVGLPRRSESEGSSEIADKWLKRHVEGKKLRSEFEIKRLLNQHVLPKWKNTPFLEIRRRQVNDLLDHIEDHHGLSSASSVLAVIRGIVNWYQSREEDYRSPIVRGMRAEKLKARDRILNDDEIRALWNAAEGSYGGIIKLALLTAQRKDKITTMKWDDVADDTWTIATEPREKGNPGQLRLPQIALDIIAGQPRIAGNPYVFASGTKKHFNSWSQRKDEIQAKLPANMAPWTVHDLRRTARSLMARAGVQDNVAERVLGHAIPGIHGVYNRHGYADEKAEALKRLAALIASILNPPQHNVIAFPPAAN
jgi:integrase